jgi:hypothetical protein
MAKFSEAEAGTHAFIGELSKRPISARQAYASPEASDG